MKRIPSAVVFILISIFIGLVLGEVALRVTGFSAPIWYKPDPEMGWGLRPGAKGWFATEGRAYVQISVAGFRDRTHDLAKPKGTYRVAVLGDSYAEAMQVDFKSTFGWRLQEKLAGCAPAGTQVEVMNFGVSGFGTAQESLMLESRAMRYKPDLVLLAFTNGNDLRNNSAKLEPEKDRPFYRIGSSGNLFLDASFGQSEEFHKRSAGWMERFRAASDNLRVVQLIHGAKNNLAAWRAAGSAHANDKQADSKNVPGVEPGTDVSAFAPPRDPDWEDAWVVTERIIAKMNDYASRHQARFAVTTVTHSAQVHPDAAVRKNTQDALGVKDLFYIERRMQELGKRQGFAVIPLAQEMQRRADADKIYFHGFKNIGMGTGHWNEDGHRVAAEILARRLCSHAFD